MRSDCFGISAQLDRMSPPPFREDDKRLCQQGCNPIRCIRHGAVFPDLYMQLYPRELKWFVLPYRSEHFQLRVSSMKDVIEVMVHHASVRQRLLHRGKA